jgi:hypothetical protein
VDGAGFVKARFGCFAAGLFRSPSPTPPVMLRFASIAAGKSMRVWLGYVPALLLLPLAAQAAAWHGRADPPC